MFSGTPCQVAAIKAYVGKYAEDLYTIELVCHGVLNDKYWQDYIHYLENKHGGKIVDFRFRGKNTKDKFSMNYIYNKNGLEKECVCPSVLSYYYYSFLKGKVYRPSCYECPFAQMFRQADITICDYWGYKGEKFKNLHGISAVLVHGKKGKYLFELGKNLLTIEETDFCQVAEQNEQLKKPSSKEKYDEEYLMFWNKKGAAALAKKHKKEHWKAFLKYLFHE